MSRKAAYVQEIEDAIEVVRKRVTKYPELNWNEHQTRYSLIDPMLQALGWDVSDPSKVNVEASNGSRDKPDYVLRRKGRQHPVAVVEAKRVAEDIQFVIQNGEVEPGNWMEWKEQEFTQMERYWKNLRPAAAVLTNGVFWDIYCLNSARGSLKGKRIDYFNILNQSPTTYFSSLKKLHRTRGDW